MPAALVHPVLRSATSHVRDELRMVHLRDATAEVDPLYELIGGDGMTLARSLDSPLLRWRAARQIETKPGIVVAWGENALRACRLARLRPVLYRPAAAVRRPPPYVQRKGQTVVAIVHGGPQFDRFRQAGWPADRLRVVLPPVIRMSVELPQREPGEFRWLLSGDATGDAGLREAVWAGTLLYFMERPARLHRLVICGDGPNQRRAKRFVDQLGLPGLALPLPRARVEQVVDAIDAALLISTGPTDPLTAAAVAAAGVPAVTHGQSDDGAALAGRRNVRISPGIRSRVVTREMLRLVDDGLTGTAGEGCYQPEAVRRAWYGVVEGIAGSP